MEEQVVVLYWCYGLNIVTVPLSKEVEFIDALYEKEEGEAGKDGRKLKFLASVPYGAFSDAIINIFRNGLSKAGAN